MQKEGTGSDAASAKDAEDFLGYSVDALFEKVFRGGSVLTLEGEYKVFETDYKSTEGVEGFALYDGSSIFGTAAFLFPNEIGLGRLQPYVRYTQNSPDEGDSSDLTELGLNYVINGHNLRFNANVTNGDASFTGAKSSDAITTASFGVQFQI
jgi:hypothetical protein